MGNILNNYQSQLQSNYCTFNMENKFVPVSEFKFMNAFEDETTNGLYLNNIYLPEEIIADILSQVPSKDLLKLTLVCKKWCNIIKSENFWINIYNKRKNTKAKKLPWYVHYCFFTTNNFDNLLRNGNGQNQFKYWKIISNSGDEFRIEDPPCGSDPLPLGLPEFNGYTSCFATSFGDCHKKQEILLTDKRLFRYILNKFKPHIYVSEWVAGRFDCGCIYRLGFRGYNEDYKEEAKYMRSVDSVDGIETGTKPLIKFTKMKIVNQWEGRTWEKVELLIEDYPNDVAILIFDHLGRDTQFWKGHYGSKMAGGVVKFVFDSIKPLCDDVEMEESQLL